MADAKGPLTAASARLVHCDVRAADSGFRLRLQTDRGETIDVIATHDQLDLLADMLDDVLLGDPTADPDED